MGLMKWDTGRIRTYKNRKRKRIEIENKQLCRCFHCENARHGNIYEAPQSIVNFRGE